MPLLSKQIADRLIMRRRLLANVFTTTDRILTGDRSLKVTMLDKNSTPGFAVPNAPAFSQYPDIYIQGEGFGDLAKAETVVALLGANYHELCHIMFTPRLFKQQFMSDQMQLMAYRILEDQRIESMFTALYEPAGKYFTQMFISIYVGDPTTYESAFLVSYGRSYLPKEIRDEFESRFERQDLIARSKKHIDDYKKYVSEDFAGTAPANTVKNFARVLRELSKVPPTECDSSDQENGEVSDQEQEATDKENERRRRERKTGEDQSNFWDEDEDDDEDEDEEDEGEDSEGSSPGEDSEDDDDEGDAGSDGGSEDDNDGDEDSDDADDQDGEGGEADSENQEEESSSGGSDADSDSDSDEDGDASDSGMGEGESEPGDSDDESDGVGETPGEMDESAFTDEELKDYLDEIIDAVNEDEAVEQEVSRIQEAINDRGSIDVVDFGKAAFDIRPVSASMTMEATRISEELRRLYAEVEPGWKYGSDVGKLNVGRAMLTDDPDEIFDEWDEGREQDVGLEVVISVDISGSMNGREIESASIALWAIKRGLDDTESHVTVLGFGEGTVGLMERNEKVDWGNYKRWDAPGYSTVPAGNFHLARRVLQASEMPNKLFVILTDGGWASYDDDGTYLDDVQMGNLIDEIPGTKMYLEIGGGSNAAMREHFDVAWDMKSPDGLAEIVRLAVVNMLSRRHN